MIKGTVCIKDFSKKDFSHFQDRTNVNISACNYRNNVGNAQPLQRFVLSVCKIMQATCTFNGIHKEIQIPCYSKVVTVVLHSGGF